MTGATTLGEPVSITFGAPTAMRLREFDASGSWPALAWLGGLGLVAWLPGPGPAATAVVAFPEPPTAHSRRSEACLLPWLVRNTTTAPGQTD